jgi:preprotein translocase subunit SecY
MVAMLPIIATLAVFAIVVYIQSIKVEIPLAFTSFRGFSRRWPLNLIYTSNIPVILVAALLANLQLMGNITAHVTDDTGMKCGFLGCYNSQGQPTSGFVLFTTPPSSVAVHVFFVVMLLTILAITMTTYFMKYKNNLRIFLISLIIGIVLAIGAASAVTGLPTGEEFLRISTYLIILTGGAVVFSIFWISTSGMDSRSVAEQIEGMGMQLPGFRRDPRIVEQVLDRYIPTLAIMSGLLIGLLAAVADFTGALGTGTGILLTVMIVHNLYEQIASRYVEDMHPSLRKFFS